MVTSVKPKKILGFDAPIIINLYICDMPKAGSSTRKA
jgi:hypothetical protein